MDLRQIQYFVALFEERSITKAARRLNVVQPALSMQISRLEKKFSTQFFERTSRGVIPTVIGHEFYGMCQKILDDVYAARRHLEEASGKVSGEIAIGVMPSIAASVLPEILSKFKTNYPDVMLRIVEAYSGSLVDWMHSKKLDLAVVNASGIWAGMAALPLIRDHLVLVTGRKTSRHRLECPARALNEYRLVLPSARQGMRTLIDSILAASGIVLKPEIELDSLGPTIELVREGDWATILPIMAVIRPVESKVLKAHKIIEPSILRDVVVIHDTHRPLTVPAQLFVNMLKDELELLLINHASSAGSAALVRRA